MREDPRALYYETKIAEKLGVTRDELAEVRQSLLKQNRAWKKNGRDVVLTGDGLRRVLDHFEKMGCEVDHDFSQCAVGKRRAGSVELTVSRLFANPRLLLATDRNGEEVRVRVPDSSNFRPQMSLIAIPPAEPPAPQIYRLDGRCPRFPGRW